MIAATRLARIACGALAAGLISTSAGAGLISICTIDFEGTCPNVETECGATFSGGVGCEFDFLEFCYSSGMFSYEVTPDLPATIDFDPPIGSAEMLFANLAGTSGVINFFDADDENVGSLGTNGNCQTAMPPMQLVEFDTPAVSAEITAIGGTIYIDDLTITTAPPNSGEPADLDGDGTVGPADLAQLLGAWGECGKCPQDLNGDGTVGPADLAQLLGAWGPVGGKKGR